MVHVKSHLSNKPFQCQHCNKGFLNASSLALHSKTHTTGPTTVACPIDSCGKEFRDNNLLEEHLQTHKQSMLYQCSLCSEKFEQSCLLVQHVKSHIGDKPFQVNRKYLFISCLNSLSTFSAINAENVSPNQAAWILIFVFILARSHSSARSVAKSSLRRRHSAFTWRWVGLLILFDWNQDNQSSYAKG